VGAPGLDFETWDTSNLNRQPPFRANNLPRRTPWPFTRSFHPSRDAQLALIFQAARSLPTFLS